MYFRVRTSLTERPGALASLATRCGDAGLNILGLQIFPDLGRVTDELVISAPEDWTAGAVSELVSGAGGDEVSVEPCTTHDLIDQPTRWLDAAQDVVADPELLPALLDQLLGSRREHWTATEQARAAALTVLAGVGDASRPAASEATVEYDETGSGVRARIGGHVVGAACFGTERVEELSVQVAPAWRRLGIGSTLLHRAAVGATSRGIAELVLLAPADDEGFVPWVCSAGFTARIKVSGDVLRARVTLARVRV